MGHSASKAIVGDMFSKRSPEQASISAHPVILVVCFVIIGITVYMPFLALMYRICKASKLKKDVEKPSVKKSGVTFTVFPPEAFDKDGNLIKDQKNGTNTQEIPGTAVENTATPDVTKPASTANNETTNDNGHSPTVGSNA